MSSPSEPYPSEKVARLASQMRGFGTRNILLQQKIADSLGLYSNDLKSVDILRETGPITAGELSRITGMATGSITALIDRLEQAGYVKREHDPSDRRRVIIVPQYEHRQEVQAKFKTLQESANRLCSSYSDEQIDFLSDFIGKINTIFEQEIRNLSRKNKE